jgi:hypothetical protein
MTTQQEIKSILVDLAVDDKLPLDMTQLDHTIFDRVINPLLERIAILDEIFSNHPQIAEMYQDDEQEDDYQEYSDETIQDFLHRYGTPGNDIKDAEFAINMDMVYLHKYDTWIHQNNMLWSSEENDLARYLWEHNPAPEI